MSMLGSIGLFLPEKRRLAKARDRAQARNKKGPANEPGLSVKM